MRINNFESLMKYISKYKNNPKKMVKIKENFDKYLDMCNEQSVIFFINQIRDVPGMEKALYYSSEEIYRKFGIETILKTTACMGFKDRFEYIYEMYEGIRFKYYTVDEYIEDLMKYNENGYICENMEQVIASGDINLLINCGLLKKLKTLDSDKFSKIHSDIVCKMTGIKPKLMDSVILWGLTKIVEEIAENENVDISDVEYVQKGTTAQVYKLGNKVIKFGKSRLTDKIPYHRRILQPLIRKQILRNLYVEVSEYIGPDKKITDEDAYLIYKELRDDGIIWLDAKMENLGRLEKENIIHFNEKLYAKNETVGYIPGTIREDKTLKKGDLVIIDTDFLFREQDFDINLLDARVNTYFYKICEQRYQEEKNPLGKASKGIFSSIPNSALTSRFL